MNVIIKQDNRKKLIAEKDQAIARVLEQWGLLAVGHAQDIITANIPRANKVTDYVPTGNLHNSISHRVEGDTVYVGTDVEYAIYNEVGTSRMSGIHFLRNAVADHVDEYKRVLEEELKR